MNEPCRAAVDPTRRPRVAAAFASAFEGAPTHVARAPGRVNLIGEHVDYHGGPVLPQSLALDTWIAFRATGDATLRLRSLRAGPDRDLELALGASMPCDAGDWRRYAIGVVEELRARGVAIGGLCGVIDSTVPAGAGLSSSAALLVAIALALIEAGGTRLDRGLVLDAARATEHRHVGVESGVMDFAAALHGRADGPILIDCATGAIRPVVGPPPTHGWAIVASGVHHELAVSAYNERVRECRTALTALRATGVTEADELAALDQSRLRAALDALPPALGPRVRHVVTESRRVTDVVRALEHSDVAAVGQALSASHASLRDDYAVSCPEVDTLVELAESVDGVAGSRITGGGFGGSTVTLLATDAWPAFEARVTEGYRSRWDREPLIVPVRGGAAASVGAWDASPLLRNGDVR